MSDYFSCCHCGKELKERLIYCSKLCEYESTKEQIIQKTTDLEKETTEFVEYYLARAKSVKYQYLNGLEFHCDINVNWLRSILITPNKVIVAFFFSTVEVSGNFSNLYSKVLTNSIRRANIIRDKSDKKKIKWLRLFSGKIDKD